MISTRVILVRFSIFAAGFLEFSLKGFGKTNAPDTIFDTFVLDNFRIFKSSKYDASLDTGNMFAIFVVFISRKQLLASFRIVFRIRDTSLSN